MNIIHRHDAINFLIKKYELQEAKYLEIGVFQGETIKRVNAAIKDGVDTEDLCKSDYVNFKMTSDNFFKLNPNRIYDVIFIDGLHTAYQVSKDLINSLNNLSINGGVIIFDDVYPHNEYEQRGLDLSNYGYNTGDCWKAIAYYFDDLLKISDDVVFFKDVERGAIGFKIKKGKHNLILNDDIPSKDNGILQEWSKYEYYVDYQNFFNKMMKYLVNDNIVKLLL